MGACSLGERQSGVDQRFDAAGGEVVEQRAVDRRADVRAIVEAMDREETHRRAAFVMPVHSLHETGVGRAVETAV